MSDVPFYRKLPARRCRPFVEGTDPESARFSKEYPDFVEVPSHIKRDGRMVPNPEFEAAQFEFAYAFKK